MTRRQRWLLWAILLLALGLRVFQLDGQSLWYDEGTSVALAGRGLGNITRSAAADIHPPFYYYLLHGWTALVGFSPTAVRSLSALIGTILVALTWVLGRQLFGPTVGLTAAFLAAVSPFQVYYSQETRMYILAAMLGALSMVLAVELARRWVLGIGYWI
ncbi:MAG: glycosyltransferase family 39 protein, partial [Anaerolineae bacterium]